VAVDRKKGESDGQTSDDDYEQFGGEGKSSKIMLESIYYTNMWSL